MNLQNTLRSSLSKAVILPHSARTYVTMSRLVCPLKSTYVSPVLIALTGQTTYRSVRHQSSALVVGVLVKTTPPL